MLKNNEGISIIIPCYNVEKYIEKCLNSIISQKLKKYEIILVDDCSKDGTWKTINKYAKKYDNIICMKNEKNSGAGFSRNVALKIAKYDYVSFIDSDDYVEDNFYEALLNNIKKEQSDVAVCDINVRYENGKTPDTRSQACVGKQDKINYINNGLAASPCNKLFKKELLIKYPFAENIMNEDIPTVLAILMSAKKISYVDDTFYNYIQRSSSVQNSVLSDKRLDLFKALDLLEKRAPRNKKNQKYWDAIIYNQIIMFMIYVIPKENNFKIRWKYLKKFNQLSKKYVIRKNPLWWIFLRVQGKYHNIYYRMLLKLNCNGFHFLSSCLISFYKFYHSKIKKSVIKNDLAMNDLIKVAKKQNKKRSNKKTISVIVPNYNYEEFMYERMYSILYQQVKIDELIILDDCSKDNSRELIDAIVDKLQPYINIKKVYNETNSGSAFKQWRKGFEMANSDYVWIAEADDYCEHKFLKTIMKPVKRHDDIYISYCDTAFIDKDGLKILRTIKPEIDIMQTGHWDKNFINKGADEFKNYSFLNCTIANVSSIIFKKQDYSKFFEESGKFKQAGDWLFYVNVMRQGKIAYANNALNYYRVHGSNVTSTTKKQDHLNEIMKIHDYFDKKFKLNKNQKQKIEGRYEFLKRVWCLDEK